MDYHTNEDDPVLDPSLASAQDFTGAVPAAPAQPIRASKRKKKHKRQEDLDVTPDA